MVFRWLVNAGLLAIPIGTTVGILVGIDLHRHAAGQAPLFNVVPGSGTGGNIDDSGGGIKDNGFTETQYCQKDRAISPSSKGVQYTLNPNQWGWNVGDPGLLCMNVTAFHNYTYATESTAPEFSVTWQYPPGPETAPVHAFPHIQVDNGVMPIQIQSLKQVNLDLHWTYGPGNTPVASTDVQALTLNLVNTNVAIDMFLDADQKKAKNTTLAKYEVMVWFAKFGTSTEPIGLKKGILASQIINDTTFNLYSGNNSLEQTVLTWVASQTTEVFTGDLAPLLTQLPSLGNPIFPIGSTYLGNLGLGSETFSTNVNVTFSVPNLSIDIQG